MSTDLDAQIRAAAMNGEPDQVGRLLQQGASPCSVLPLNGRLIVAAGEGHDEVIGVLLPVVNDSKELGRALMSASRRGQVSSVRLLLDAGAPVDTHGPYGETALELAIEGWQHAAADSRTAAESTFREIEEMLRRAGATSWFHDTQE